MQFARCGEEWKVLAEQTLYSGFEFKIKRCAFGVLMPPKMHIPNIRLLHVYLDVYGEAAVLRRLLEGLRDNRLGFWVKRMVVAVERLYRDVGEEVKEVLGQQWELCARRGRVCFVRPLRSSRKRFDDGITLEAVEKARACLEELEVLAKKNIKFSPALIGDTKYT
ncbi:hypothetical protein P171DRAFT_482643 [Karstenula rhodostoma CBS 690.94]|uniref:Uncharacterized protein n=1 Tax=Karstenula rhodostoma CBS 690.94 TaxID=1392251 RepID=A0A9P4PRC2_9PLEO|nr:hypothetical protein P171DRAFT_482643 [Karstenula rhodostoma CBS 690.94]